MSAPSLVLVPVDDEEKWTPAERVFIEREKLPDNSYCSWHIEDFSQFQLAMLKEFPEARTGNHWIKDSGSTHCTVTHCNDSLPLSKQARTILVRYGFMEVVTLKAQRAIALCREGEQPGHAVIIDEVLNCDGRYRLRLESCAEDQRYLLEERVGCLDQDLWKKVEGEGIEPISFDNRVLHLSIHPPTVASGTRKPLKFERSLFKQALAGLDLSQDTSRQAVSLNCRANDLEVFQCQVIRLEKPIKCRTKEQDGLLSLHQSQAQAFQVGQAGKEEKKEGAGQGRGRGRGRFFDKDKQQLGQPGSDSQKNLPVVLAGAEAQMPKGRSPKKK